MKPYVKAKTFINNPGRFFHYEPLFTSSFSKNIIMPESGNIFKKLRCYEKTNLLQKLAYKYE